MYLVSRTKTFIKLYLILSFVSLFTYIFLNFFYLRRKIIKKFDEEAYIKQVEIDIRDIYSFDLNYILIWGNGDEDLEGLKPFVERNCEHTNCYITRNKTMINLSDFDVIIFNSSAMGTWVEKDLPDRRSPKQKYIFYGMQPAKNHPICSTKLDDYFNWTWSYKFSSTIFNPFIEVLNFDGSTIAPNQYYVNWEGYNEDKIRYTYITKHNKKKAMALVLENCLEPENSMYRKLKNLQIYMSRRSLDFDIYGCKEKLQCTIKRCMKFIKKDYYFFLVLERSFENDYVSDEVLKAYDNDMVPVVAGGADLRKFLPYGSYIDFKNHTEKSLTDIIEGAINNATIYNNFFAWKQEYVIQNVDKLQGLCTLCMFLNSDIAEMYRTYTEFRRWWYPGNLKTTCYPKRY